MASSKPDPTLNEELIRSFIEQQYNLTGKILTAEQAFEEFGIPVGHYKKVLSNPLHREALEEKGLIFERFEASDWSKDALTPKQLMTANAMLDLTDTRSDKKKLQDLEVHTQTWQAWLKDPVFKNYLRVRAEQMIGDNAHQADLAFLDRIRAGDMKAIGMWYEMTGKYTPQRANASQVDVQNILTKVIEVIIEEVDDRDTAIRISNRLRALIGARNMASALMGEEEQIVVPEVVNIRSIEELNELE